MPPSDMFKRCEEAPKDHLFLISPVWENLPVSRTPLLWQMLTREAPARVCTCAHVHGHGCMRTSLTNAARPPACQPASHPARRPPPAARQPARQPTHPHARSIVVNNCPHMVISIGKMMPHLCNKFSSFHVLLVVMLEGSNPAQSGRAD